VSDVEFEARLRAVELKQAQMEERVQPLLALSTSMAGLATQIADLKSSLASLKGQALVLGACATVGAPIVWELITRGLK